MSEDNYHRQTPISSGLLQTLNITLKLEIHYFSEFLTLAITERKKAYLFFFHPVEKTLRTVHSLAQSFVSIEFC